MKIAVPRTAPIILFHSKESISASSHKPVFGTGKIRGDITRPSLDVIAAKRRTIRPGRLALDQPPSLKPAARTTKRRHEPDPPDSRPPGLDPAAGKAPGRNRRRADDRARVAPGRGSRAGTGGRGGRRSGNRRGGGAGGRAGGAHRSGPAVRLGPYLCGASGTGPGRTARCGGESAGRSARAPPRPDSRRGGGA